MIPQTGQTELRLDVKPAVFRPSVEILTRADPQWQKRLEAFWLSLNRLIFAERLTIARKAAILKRYARSLRNREEADLSNCATSLANSYEEQAGLTRHWT